MNCPVCQKTLASTLSICFSCGAMVHDTVREELAIKSGTSPNITPTVNQVNTERKEIYSMPVRPSQPGIENLSLKIESLPVKIENPPVKTEGSFKPVHTQSQTGEINVRATTPTLVEFQSKNVTIPDWRLKIQNAVQQRKGGIASASAVAAPAASVETAPVQRTRLVTNGANALKAGIIEDAEPVISSERMSRVLQRIEKSRQVYLVEEETAVETPVLETAAPAKNFPFRIAQKNTEIATPVPAPKATINSPVKPKLISSMRNINGDLDTNKLPPLSAPGKIVVDLESLPTVSTSKEEIRREALEPKPVETIQTIHIEAAVTVEEEIIHPEAEPAEIDDLAPFAMRFNSGLFDLIIGSFTSLLLLSPFMISGGDWFSFKGFLAFTVVCSIVMFIYLTASVGFYGRTFGMRMFSLELIDVEENDYPTMHQAAVNSAVYLLSLIFGGVGFLTIPFNEEKRAVHDLISGTIVVKE